MTTEKYNDIFHFLRAHHRKEGEIYTHTTMSPPGSYHVPEEKMEILYQLLDKAVQDGKKVHLTERPTDPSPIKIDLDFRFPVDQTQRLYTKKHLEEIVNLYNKTIIEYVDIPAEKVNAYVFERASPYKSGGNNKEILKDGIHIMYPDIVVSTTVQHMIRDHVISKCAGIFSDLPLTNGIADVIDNAVINKNNWLMYGCSKPNLPPYKLTHIFNYNVTVVENSLNNLELIKNLSNFAKDKIIYNVHPSKELQFKELTEKNKRKGKEKTVYIKKKSKSDSKDVEDALILVSMLNPERADVFKTWLDLGWCLHNIDNSLLPTWIEFSKQSSSFEEGKCEKEWARARVDGLRLNIGSLCRWAKEDNPHEYAVYRRKSISSIMYKSLSCTEQDVAAAVYELYKYDFKFTDAKHYVWYEYEGHRWHKSDMAMGLRKKLAHELLNEYIYVMNDNYNFAAAATTSNDENEKDHEKTGGFPVLAKKLKTIPFKNKVLKECETFFHDKKFFDKLNTDPNLIGFENGVYDLKNGEFRDGRPEDCVSVSTGISFMEFDENDLIIKEISEFMAQILPIERVREYVWLLLASFLYGLNIGQKFYIFVGKGANGKSKLVNLFEYAFGDYCEKLSIGQLTQKRVQNGAPNPELAGIKHARFVSFQEPEEKETLNTGCIKEWSGDDRIKIRGLYTEPITYTPGWKMVFLTNYLPKIPPHDYGIWRRIVVIPFISKFCDNPNPNLPYQFPSDEKLLEKLKGWKEGFMWMLLQYYKKYLEVGLTPPPEVIQATEAYQRDCDAYIEFVEDKLEKADDTEILQPQSTYRLFKEWFRETQDGKRTAPSQKDFKVGISTRIGDYISGGRKPGWRGWKVRETEEDTLNV
jgi:P4 family phage/plasmid primase-like protien